MRRENALISNLPSVCDFVSVKDVPLIGPVRTASIWKVRHSGVGNRGKFGYRTHQ
jgi:hypothetical protein